jgi:hypothetical protein
MWVVVLGVGLHFGIKASRSLFKPSQHQRWTLSSKISFLDIASQRRTLLIATSAKCQYARESGSFHKMLAARARVLGLRTVVLVDAFSDLPPELHSVPQSEGDMFMEAKLGSLGVPGTPTVALLTGANEVVGLWIGKLGRRQEQACMARIVGDKHTLIDSGNEGSMEELSPDGLVTRLRGAVLIDVRDREAYYKHHSRGSVNIPIDELTIRARVEYPLHQVITLDCSFVSFSTCVLAKEALRSASFARIRYLNIGRVGVSCLTCPVR